MKMKELLILVIFCFIVGGSLCVILGCSNPVIFDVMIIIGFMFIIFGFVLIVAWILYMIFVGRRS